MAASGPETLKFLQGMVTNDVKGLVNPHDALYTAVLNGKGRAMFEGHLALSAGGDVLLDVCRTDVTAALAHLNRYRLRAQVNIRDVSDRLAVTAVVPHPLPSPTVPSALLAQLTTHVSALGGTAFMDKRCPRTLGLRVFAPVSSVDAPLAAAGVQPRDSTSVYTVTRAFLGLPEG